MSLVCFPFKKENPTTVLRNVSIATNHEKVRLVLLVGAIDNDCYQSITRGIRESAHNIPVRVILQKRLGSLRYGKGDGMNTAMQYFLHAHEIPQNTLGKPLRRLHFYDADIESFDADWITKAEEGMDLGYDVVRHYFPRSSTDAQVTWQVTKVGFAHLWPLSILPWIRQPLGGELCFARRVVQSLISDPRVLAQSDWGIDTLYTFVCAQRGFSLLETYMPQGKMHALYGGLQTLKTMLCECFSAVQSLKFERVDVGSSIHHAEQSSEVPRIVRETIGYDIESSMRLLSVNWTKRQRELLNLFSEETQRGLEQASHWPEYSFMNEKEWVKAYQVLLNHFMLQDEDWCEILFRMWVARVLDYTMRHVLKGYERGLQGNMRMVDDIRKHRTKEILSLDQLGVGDDLQAGGPILADSRTSEFDSDQSNSSTSPPAATCSDPLSPVSSLESISSSAFTMRTISFG